MSKLDDLKAKVSGVRATLAEKADKIAFLKKWRESHAATPKAGPKPEDPLSLGVIYRDGGTGTRFQVLAFYLFLVVAVVSAGSLVKKMAGKMRSSAEHDKMVNDISHGLTVTKERKEAEAQMLSLGQFTTNVFVHGADEPKLMNIDLWVRVSDPQTAATINDRNEVFREKTMDVLHALYVEHVSPLEEAGKVSAKERILEALNRVTKPGKVEEVFIQNLVVQ